MSTTGRAWSSWPLRGARHAGAGAFEAGGGWPRRLAREAAAAGRHDAPALHRLVLRAGEEEASVALEAAARKEPMRETQRVEGGPLRAARAAFRPVEARTPLPQPLESCRLQDVRHG